MIYAELDIIKFGISILILISILPFYFICKKTYKLICGIIFRIRAFFFLRKITIKITDKTDPRSFCRIIKIIVKNNNKMYKIGYYDTVNRFNDIDNVSFNILEYLSEFEKDAILFYLKNIFDKQKKEEYKKRKLAIAQDFKLRKEEKLKESIAKKKVKNEIFSNKSLKNNN